MTTLFWLMVLGGLWLSFGVPAAKRIGPRDAYYLLPSRWASLWMIGGACSIAMFTALQGWVMDRHRATAWPSHLERLTTPPANWPGFELSAGIVGVLVLILGCVYMVLPISAVSGLIAGVALLMLAHRRWNENLADAGLALITLSVVSACMIGFHRPVWSSRGYADILNRALLGLAVMTAVWHWLARVWEQQLDDGQPWTTTGRLVRTARRVGFLIAATGVLIGLHLTLWPRLPWIVNSDDSRLRWVAGLGGHLLMLLALLSALCGTRRSTIGWLALFTIASGVGFVIARAPNARFSAWFMVHWPFALALVAGLCLVLARVLANRRSWRGLQEALIFTGVMLAPMVALTGVCLTDAALLGQSPPWLPAATFGALAIAYVIAAIYPGPSTFTTVAALCCGVSLWKLRDMSSHRFLTSPYFFTFLTGVCLTLIAFARPSRTHAATQRALKWLGGGLALLSLMAGWLLAR